MHKLLTRSETNPTGKRGRPSHEPQRHVSARFDRQLLSDLNTECVLLGITVHKAMEIALVGLLENPSEFKLCARMQNTQGKGVPRLVSSEPTQFRINERLFALTQPLRTNNARYMLEHAAQYFMRNSTSLVKKYA